MTSDINLTKAVVQGVSRVEVIVNSTSYGLHQQPDVTALTGGGWVVTWVVEDPQFFGNRPAFF